ncbi:SLBB domain-containing protein [Zavarzinia sp. CC-PAN008]|uniref:SLBB domain-containing protein n=1 Tax=Zavarzinia sp. CC-PAN008 TaxID=3243332 RepID=UPI003F746AE1
MRNLAAGLLAVAGATLAAAPAQAQSASDLIPPDLMRMLESRGTPSLPGSGSAGGTLSPSTTTIDPVMPSLRRPPSRLEQQYSQRAGQQLLLFGYDAFGVARPLTDVVSGGVQDSYVLGIGDALVVNLRGEQSARLDVTVDREGNVVLPDLAPIPAAGRSFGEFRQALADEVARIRQGATAYVSLSQTRQLSLLVLGAVASPGTIRPTAFASVVDALALAGGILPEGTLRNIAIARGQSVVPVDLYGLLAATSDPVPLGLVEGDRIVVPPIGATVAVAGEVKRPGIYELAPGQDSMTLGSLVEMAGGGLTRSRYRYEVLRIRGDGRTELQRIGSLDEAILRDGEILFVRPSVDDTVSRVTLVGAVKIPGEYSLASSRSMRGLIRDLRDLDANPYLPMAVIERPDPATGVGRYIPVDLRAVFSGGANVTLKDRDRVIVLSLADVEFLSSRMVLEALQLKGAQPNHLAQEVQTNLALQRARESGLLQGGADVDLALGAGSLAGQSLAQGQAQGQGQGQATSQTPGIDAYGRLVGVAPSLTDSTVSGVGSTILNQQSSLEDQRAIGALGPVAPSALSPAAAACQGVAFLARNVRSRPQGSLDMGQLAVAASSLGQIDLPCPTIFMQQPALLTYLMEHSVLVRGAVLRPGIYPIASEAAVQGAVEIARGGVAAGGAAGVEVLEAGGRNMSLASVDPSGVVHVVQESVTLVGSVLYPGSRPLQSAQTVRALIGDPRLLKEGTYLPLGLLLRRSAAGDRSVTPIPLGRVLSGRVDFRLQPGDIVKIFNGEEVRALLSTQAAGAGTTGGQVMASADAAGAMAVGPMAGAGGGPLGGGPGGGGDGGVTPGDLVDPLVLGGILASYAVEISGEVRLPGRYPLVPGTSVDELVQAAGGFAASADLARVEVTRFVRDPQTNTLESRRELIDFRPGGLERILLSSSDLVMVPAVATDRGAGSIEIAGEVVRPGRFSFVRGERLSSVLARAGGLTDVAYPYGAVFQRRSAQQFERQARERSAQDINRSLAQAMTESSARSKDQQLSPEQINVVRNLANDLRQAPVLGRIVVEVDPRVLAARPDLDILVEEGDTVFIPRRPTNVTVSGEVLNAGSLPFRPEWAVDDYIEAAGGLNRSADDGRIFILMPNGLARPENRSMWSTSSVPIPPGATIIVPLDPAPFDFLQSVRDVSTVLGQIAVTAASLSVISTRGD